MIPLRFLLLLWNCRASCSCYDPAKIPFRLAILKNDFSRAPPPRYLMMFCHLHAPMCCVCVRVCCVCVWGCVVCVCVRVCCGGVRVCVVCVWEGVLCVCEGVFCVCVNVCAPLLAAVKNPFPCPPTWLVHAPCQQMSLMFRGAVF